MAKSYSKSHISELTDIGYVPLPAKSILLVVGGSLAALFLGTLKLRVSMCHGHGRAWLQAWTPETFDSLSHSLFKVCLLEEQVILC
jgi:hypothetical protein